MKWSWRIREKLLAFSIVLLVVVSVLAYNSFHGASRFRALTKSIRTRSSELPLAATLGEKVSDLRITFLRYSLYKQSGNASANPGNVGPSISGFDDEISLRREFLFDLEQVKSALAEYENQLQENLTDGRMLSDTRREQSTVAELKTILADIATDFAQTDWVFSSLNQMTLDQELSQLQEQVTLLPGFLTQRMNAYHEQARTEYKTWMFLSGTMTLAAFVILGLFALGIYIFILKPLRILVKGSRQVADGDFDHRIDVKTKDEVADLAAAMNLMTENFQAIRNDLDEQVRKRTKEAVRSDRLASVGFLAAGVAHEINNPLASIAWSAESVEKRFDEAFEMESDSGEVDPDVEFIRKYLARIQQESFRCKGITERLLDFSRMGDSERKLVDLTKIVQGVIDMVKNLGRYREKNIQFSQKMAIQAEVNGQEFKQVVMNLLTNALDCVAKNGNVWIETKKQMGNAVIVFKDDGCGMSNDVLEHIFEPFFTRRKHGEGTGLGLSISHQIIADHGGIIAAYSEGKGKGSTFEVSVPLRKVSVNSVAAQSGEKTKHNEENPNEKNNDEPEELRTGSDDQKEKEEKRIVA